MHINDTPPPVFNVFIHESIQTIAAIMFTIKTLEKYSNFGMLLYLIPFFSHYSNATDNDVTYIILVSLMKIVRQMW